jgi:hypothetical protein
MNGRFFVTLLLFGFAAVIGLLILFNFYPPAGNSLWTLVGIAVWAALAIWAARRAAKGRPA